ncbi:MAG: hypothetical protein IJU95_10790 [Treponema sp.]|nr:hypothetical protein [Treponema sp.]
MKKKLALVAALCALVTASLTLASCDYWSEDWYKKGESTTVTPGEAETGEAGEVNTETMTMDVGSEIEVPEATSATSSNTSVVKIVTGPQGHPAVRAVASGTATVTIQNDNGTTTVLTVTVQ